MPMYDYRCDECKEVWEENLTIAKKDEPCERACPHCQKEGSVKKHVGGFPGIGTDTTLTPDKKTGGMWSERMELINSGLPDRYKTGSDMTGHRWN